MFNSIGARVDSLDDGVEIYPSEAQADSQWPLPSSLKRIVGLLTNAAPWYVATNHYTALN